MFAGISLFSSWIVFFPMATWFHLSDHYYTGDHRGSDLAVRMMLAYFFRPVQSPSPSDYIHALPNKPTDVLC